VITPDDVLSFWFDAPASAGFGRFRDQWFQKDDRFDADIRDRFGVTVVAAREGELAGWVADPRGALALTIVLDQFPRNLFRGSVGAFAGDPIARTTVRRAIDRGFDRLFPPVPRMFFYLPFEHSENLADQRRSIALFFGMVRDFDDPALIERIRFAVLRHAEIVERFGRFPHRNVALGRTTSPEEARFLTEPRSSF
jgi:uncharacterized protein (DUF924 family)